MSQTQLDDLTAGAGDEASVGLIANVLRNKGGEGRWESMRPLSAGVFGLEIATLSPQRERPITSSPVRSLPAARAPPALWLWGRRAVGAGHPHPCPWACVVRSERELSTASGHRPRGRGSSVGGAGWASQGMLCLTGRLGITGDAVTRGRVGWSSEEVSSSSRGLQSHAAVWGRFSNTAPSKLDLKAPLGSAQPPKNCSLPSP